MSSCLHLAAGTVRERLSRPTPYLRSVQVRIPYTFGGDAIALLFIRFEEQADG
jgi:hypothetical protein